MCCLYLNIYSVYLVSKCAALTRYSHGKAISLLRARPSGGGQAGGLHHQPAAEHRQDQPEQEADHQDAPRHHHRLHRLLVSQVWYNCTFTEDIFYRKFQIFSPNFIKYFLPTGS